MNSKTARNTLTIDEVKEVLTAEHAGKLLASEFWWTIVPSTEGSGSYAETGDSSQFWALVTAIRELGQPLGFVKEENHLGNMIWKAHNKPELALASIIKPTVKATKPDMDLIKIRCEVNGQDPAQVFVERMAEYNAQVAVAEEKNRKAIARILSQEPAPGEGIFDTSVELGDFNEEKGEYDEYEVVYGEHYIPIDRILRHLYSQVNFLAKNTRIPDEVFVAENTLYQAEIARMKGIVQQEEHEGAGEGSRAIDEQLLGAAGMNAGANAGK